ncbi:DUF4293 domain-containing protein [Aestuariivivens sediminicola]|uniref:DUF4293 domain-containing protein n=1 Tax=Aestuariivivens sediminicola TaxID=2913560 RepID=UPI001F5A6FCF|nr:DUF4293 domain-containing protein [Aestuariivivens sediminicola]
MLQRVQTLYLLITVVASAALIFVFPLYQVSDNDGVWVYAASDNVLLSVFLCSAVLSLITILKYKNRKTQFMLGRLNIILNFFILGFFVYQSLNLSGETVVSKKGIGMLLPIISIVFLVLANKAIKRDEDLVKSVDRLR